MFLGWCTAVAVLLAFQTVRFLWSCLKLSARENLRSFVRVLTSPFFRLNDRLIKGFIGFLRDGLYVASSYHQSLLAAAEMLM
jgi:hypothetical protein